MNERRQSKFDSVVRSRQSDLTVILENIVDPHNIGAVMRSCDAVGVREIFLLYTEAGIAGEMIKMGKKSSAGARKWLEIYYYQDLDACFDHVRTSGYTRVLSTHLIEGHSKSLYDLDLTQPTALLFGNERLGISVEALARSDGNFVIPMVGMVESLNISVACAVSLFEASRQRRLVGFYDDQPQLSQAEQSALMEHYHERSKQRIEIRQVFLKK